MTIFSKFENAPLPNSWQKARGFPAVDFPFLPELAPQQFFLVVDAEEQHADEKRRRGQPDPGTKRQGNAEREQDDA